MTELTYSAGPDQACWHDDCSRLSFPNGQRVYGRDWSLVVTDLAEDYHCNHDGWEANWPLQIRIYEDGAEVARFSVERESQPVFYAWEVEAPAAEGSRRAGEPREGGSEADAEPPQTTAQP